MLPSLGLFKQVHCPYNGDDNTGCHRPFCHFKHPRKDDPPASTPTESSLSNATASYPRYIPFPVAEDDNSSSCDRPEPQRRNSIPSWNNTAEYVPQPVAPGTAVEEKADPDPEDLLRILEEGGDEEEKQALERKAGQNEGNSKTEESALETDDLMQLLADSGDEKERERPVDAPKELPADGEGGEIKRKDRDKEKRSERSSSSKDSKRHSSSSSSSTTRRSSSSHSSSSSSRHHHRHSEASSSSSSSKHSRSSSSNSSRKRPSASSDAEDRKSSSSSSHKHHKSSSSSSSSHKRRHKSDSRGKEGSSESKRQCVDGTNSPAILNASSSASDYDDDEPLGVEEECKMIFEQFKSLPSTSSIPPPSNLPVPTKDHNSVESQLAERFQENSSPYTETVGNKKRVAHEGGPTSRPIDRAFQAKPKHMQTALQSIFMRTEAVRKQRAEEEERAKRELEEREAQLDKVLASSSAASASSSAFRRSLVAPVANIIALQNAKKKIEELKLQQQQKTIARSAPRCTGETANVTKRIAHKATGPAAQGPAAPPVLEPQSSKINFNLRMQYYNMMVKHCTAIYDAVEDAWERAQTEELAVFKKCSSAVIYKSSATLAINKLRKEAVSAGHATELVGNKVVSHDVILAGKLGQKNSWSINRQLRDSENGAKAAGDTTIMSVGPLAGQTFDTISSAKAYNLVAECILDEEQLKENGFPRPGPRPGQAIVEGFYRREQPKPRNEDERYCQRCGKLFNIASYDLPARDECNYHPKGTGYRRGFADNHHRCCQQPAGTPGCSYSDYHVSNYIDYANLTGFVRTLDRGEDYVCTRKDIFALDCEMVYTTKELELARVTVVDITGKIVYDACVKPDNPIVDYNTQFSGLTEEILRNEKRTLRDIQAVLLSMFHSRTILVGHSLDSDLKALKLIHDTVVDTSVLYPHKMGLPKKKALKTLCIDHLKRIIQENEHGHNSAEDAEVCIQLIKAYLKNRVS